MDVSLDWQKVSYIAEHVVGTGSFGVVFQVSSSVLLRPISTFYVILSSLKNFIIELIYLLYAGKM